MVFERSAQAPGFYDGYSAFGQIDCLPAGTSRIFMTKTLGPAT